MAAFTIPSVTVAAGTHTFGPFAVAGGWRHLEFILDITALTSSDLLIEFSSDGVVWRHVYSGHGLIVGLNKLGQPITQEHITADWSGTWPAGQVRVTFTNSIAFLSSGGSLVVS